MVRCIIQSNLISFGVLIGLFLYYVANYIIRLFFSGIKCYPSGPRPVPIFGNLLMLVDHWKNHPIYFFNKMKQRYGDLYTFWLGSKAVVVINSYEMAKQLFNQKEFCNRFHTTAPKEATNFCTYKIRKSFAFKNYTDEVKALRKISEKTISKFMDTNKLTEYSNKIVEEAVNKMLVKDDLVGKQFLPSQYIECIFVRLFTQVIYGKKLRCGDPKVKQVFKNFDLIQYNFLKEIVRDFIPIMKLFVGQPKSCTEMLATSEMFVQFYYDSLKSHKLSNKLDSLCDSIIYIKKLLLVFSRKSNKDYDCILDDSNLISTLNTLFYGAIDTTIYTFKWILLLMCYYPQKQEKMRSEIEKHIGQRDPDVKDMENCHYVNAFISETLRYRNVLPFSVYHRTSCDTRIDEVLVPKGTMVVLNQYLILHDPKYWKNPHIFYPERFLDSDLKYNSQQHPAFIPFGVGKRKCVGDKFAPIVLFMVLTRLLQLTNGYNIELPQEHHIDLEPKKFGASIEPKEYYITINKQ